MSTRTTGALTVAGRLPPAARRRWSADEAARWSTRRPPHTHPARLAARECMTPVPTRMYSTSLRPVRASSRKSERDGLSVAKNLRDRIGNSRVGEGNSKCVGPGDGFKRHRVGKVDVPEIVAHEAMNGRLPRRSFDVRRTCHDAFGVVLGSLLHPSLEFRLGSNRWSSARRPGRFWEVADARGARERHRGATA